MRTPRKLCQQGITRRTKFLIKRFYLTGKFIFTEVNGNMPNKNRQNNTHVFLASQLLNEIHNIDERLE